MRECIAECGKPWSDRCRYGTTRFPILELPIPAERPPTRPSSLVTITFSVLGGSRAAATAMGSNDAPGQSLIPIHDAQASITQSNDEPARAPHTQECREGNPSGRHPTARRSWSVSDRHAGGPLRVLRSVAEQGVHDVVDVAAEGVFARGRVSSMRGGTPSRPAISRTAAILSSSGSGSRRPLVSYCARTACCARILCGHGASGRSSRNCASARSPATSSARRAGSGPGSGGSVSRDRLTGSADGVRLNAFECRDRRNAWDNLSDRLRRAGSIRSPGGSSRNHPHVVLPESASAFGPSA